MPTTPLVPQRPNQPLPRSLASGPHGAGRYARILSLAFLLAQPVLAAAPVSLTKAAGNAPVLTLSSELGADWRDVHVARLAVRTPGAQHRIEVSAIAKRGGPLTLPLAPGCSLILIDFGPPRTVRAADDWRRVTHATKIVHCAEGADLSDPTRALAQRARASGMAIAKVGSRIEIQPLLSPTTARVGSDLPIRVFVDGAAQAQAAVVAQAPDGSRRDATTDGVGAAVFTLDVAGRWHISFRHRQDGEPERVATLVFDIVADSLWRRAEVSP